MSPIRVLIVDDSVTMRALFSGILSNVPGITVLDHAASADEARVLIEKLNPDVVTLDVEMPGMSGLEFLEELMRDRPMPVIMLSTLTQKGSDATLKALELGAYECFPKPTHATIDEFNKIGPKLAKLVKAAATGAPLVTKAPAAAKVAKAPLVEVDYAPGNSLVTVVANTGGVEALTEMMGSFPVNCPPTIVHLANADGFIDAFVAKLDGMAAPRIQVVSDDQPLEQGNVYIVSDPAKHAIVDKWPYGRIRLIDGNPVGGHRPSANLLLGTIAKTAGGAGAAALLTGIGDDGVVGLMALKGAGGLALAQSPETARAGELPGLAVSRGAASKALPLDEVGVQLLRYRSSLEKAA